MIAYAPLLIKIDQVIAGSSGISTPRVTYRMAAVPASLTKRQDADGRSPDWFDEDKAVEIADSHRHLVFMWRSC